MRTGVLAISLSLALFVAAVSVAATASWASAADKVCTVWQAKAKATLTPLPKTPTEIFRWTLRAAALEKAELSALKKIPHATPAGVRALASVDTDIAEIQVGIADWRAGNKSGFARVFIAWQRDHRPHTAFVAAGARACG
jgi:hypothetical protein